MIYHVRETVVDQAIAEYSPPTGVDPSICGVLPEPFADFDRWLLSRRCLARLRYPLTEYQATYYAQPVEGESPDATGHWQGVDVDELPSECRKVAYELAAGQTVSEAGYQFPSERQMQSDGRQGDDPILLVKRTNLSDSWRVGDSFCGDHLVSGEYLRVEGRYYHLWGRYSEGVFSFRHKQLLYSIALTGLVLLGIGLFKEMS